MEEVKNQMPEICGCLKVGCVTCEKFFEPEDRPYDQAADEFKTNQEAELKILMDAAVNKNAVSHSVWIAERETKKLEDTRNYRNSDRDSAIALQARRSEALQMAYYTCHKLGHFSMDRWPVDGEPKSKREQFLSNVEEVKDLARINMKFVLEG